MTNIETKETESNEIKEVTEIIIPKKSKSRVWEVDALRGFLILFVVFDHLMFDWAFIFDFTSPFMNSVQELAVHYCKVSVLRQTVHEGFIVAFIFISGVSSSFTRDGLWRSIKLALFAVSLSVVTIIFAKATSNAVIVIRFGILHCLALCMLIGWVLTMLKVPNWIIALLALILLIVGSAYELSPLLLTEKTKGWYFIVASDKMHEMSPGDCQPLLPLLAWFLFGMIFGRIHYKQKVSLVKADISNYFAPLRFIGRHTLWVYLGSQIIMIAILLLIKSIGW